MACHCRYPCALLPLLLLSCAGFRSPSATASDGGGSGGSWAAKLLDANATEALAGYPNASMSVLLQGAGYIYTTKTTTATDVHVQGKASCGAPCGDASECSGDCPFCVNGKCAKTGCGAACADSDECGGECPFCVNGKCKKNACGAPCKDETSCSTPCPFCVGGKCQAEDCCGAPCGGAPDCSEPCPFCVNNKCKKDSCGAPCAGDGECSKPCPFCVNGQCKDSGCGAICEAASDCAGYPKCKFCMGGKCADGGCGAVCELDDDCPPNCPGCINGICAKSGPMHPIVPVYVPIGMIHQQHRFTPNPWLPKPPATQGYWPNPFGSALPMQNPSGPRGKSSVINNALHTLEGPHHA